MKFRIVSTIQEIRCSFIGAPMTLDHEIKMLTSLWSFGRKPFEMYLKKFSERYQGNAAVQPRNGS